MAGLAALAISSEVQAITFLTTQFDVTALTTADGAVPALVTQSGPPAPTLVTASADSIGPVNLAAAGAIGGPGLLTTSADASAGAPAAGPQLIKPGLYRMSSGALLRVGAKGLVVVDVSRIGGYAALMAETRRIAEASGLPLRAAVLTGAEPGRAGIVAQLLDAGVPVIAHRRLAPDLVAEAGASSAEAVKPLVAYDTDYMLRAGDIEVEIEHVGSGRTKADSVVLFRELRVVAVGDLFTAGTPQPDCAGGGSFAGWAAAIAHLTWLHFDVIVPSQGAPVGRGELAAFKEKLEELARRAAASPSGPTDCRPQK